MPDTANKQPNNRQAYTSEPQWRNTQLQNGKRHLVVVSASEVQWRNPQLQRGSSSARHGGWLEPIA